jgi:hypothetical protein
MVDISSVSDFDNAYQIGVIIYRVNHSITTLPGPIYV